MTVEELEGKLTNIYHEFAETISENETDEQIVARSKEWFVKRLSEETDNKEAIDSIANQLVGCLKQASVLSNLEKEKMNKVWMCSGSTYTQVSSGYSVEQSLPVGIYSICLTMTGYHLDRYADKFVFPYKMYGLQNEFIDHVIKTYHATEGNLGIMLTGTKGTGKTVTAKELANKLNLPIIIVKDMGDHNQSMIEFLSGIEGDCILFLDEFEKNFSESDSTILQIMDGVYNSKYRKVFLLTTNAMTINENMVGRPSRIRYVKEFGNLDLKVVNEYLDDALQVPEARQDLLDFIDSLTISTIDILGSIVDEVNIHEKLSEDTCLNIPLAKYVFDIMKFPVETEEDVTRIKEILRPGRANFPEWLGKDCEMEDKDSDTKTNEDYCSNILDGWKTRMTSQFSSLWKNQELSIGTILEDPDKDGFILVKDIYGDGETLVKIIRQKGNPSLYRGGLMF